MSDCGSATLWETEEQGSRNCCIVLFGVDFVFFFLFSPEWRLVGCVGLGSGILPLFLGLALSNYGTAKRQECLAKLSDEATDYLLHTSPDTYGEAVDVEILLKKM